MATWKSLNKSASQPAEKLNQALGNTTPKDWSKVSRRCEWRGVKFYGASRDLTGGLRVAQHEPASGDGGELQQLGAKLRTFAVEARFFGDNYAGDSQAFAALLESEGAGRYVDPTQGAFECVVDGDYQIREVFDEFAFVAVTFTLRESTRRVFDQARPASAAAKRESLFNQCIKDCVRVAKDAASLLDTATSSVRVTQRAVARASAAMTEATRRIEGAIHRNTIGLYTGVVDTANAIAEDWVSLAEKTASDFGLSVGNANGDSVAMESSFSTVQDAFAIGAFGELLDLAESAELTASASRDLAFALSGNGDAVIEYRNDSSIDSFFANTFAIMSARAVAVGYTFETYEQAISARDRLCGVLGRLGAYELAQSTYDAMTVVAQGLGFLLSAPVAPGESAITISQRLYGTPDRAFEIMRRNDIVDASFIGLREIQVLSQ